MFVSELPCNTAEILFFGGERGRDLILWGGGEWDRDLILWGGAGDVQNFNMYVKDILGIVWKPNEKETPRYRNCRNFFYLFVNLKSGLY